MQTEKRFLPQSQRRKPVKGMRVVPRIAFLVVLLSRCGMGKSKYKERKRLLDRFGEMIGQEMQGHTLCQSWRIVPKEGMTEGDMRRVLASRGMTFGVYYDCERSGRTFWNAEGIAPRPRNQSEKDYQENRTYLERRLFRISQEMRVQGQEDMRRAKRRVKQYANTDREDLHAKALADLSSAFLLSRSNDLRLSLDTDMRNARIARIKFLFRWIGEGMERGRLRSSALHQKLVSLRAEYVKLTSGGKHESNFTPQAEALRPIPDMFASGPSTVKRTNFRWFEMATYGIGEGI